MADDEKKNEVQISDKSQAKELRQKFEVNLIRFESENYDNEEAKCMHITLTDKGSENKYQIYETTFTVGDCNQIKKDARFEHIPLDKFVNLIKYCLSNENTSHGIKLKVEHSKYVQLAILYSPDQFTNVTFTLTIAAKQMSEVDLLKLRLKEAEESIQALQRNRPWKRAVAQNPAATTDQTTYNVNNYLVSITLPAKAGRYLCQFSFWVTSQHSWVYYWFKRGNTLLSNGSGRHAVGKAVGVTNFDVSGMSIVELQGNESEQDRTIRVYATGHATHKAVFRNCVLVCEELAD